MVFVIIYKNIGAFMTILSHHENIRSFFLIFKMQNKNKIFYKNSFKNLLSYSKFFVTNVEVADLALIYINLEKP